MGPFADNICQGYWMADISYSWNQHSTTSITHSGAKAFVMGMDTDKLGWYACPERPYSINRGENEKIKGVGVLVSSR